MTGLIRAGAAATLVAVACLTLGRAEAAEKACPFDMELLSFEGTPVEQARCLLRPVRMYARLGQPLEKLPEPLDSMIWQPVPFGADRTREFLAQKGITHAEVGGDPGAPISRAGGTPARYFVIHDTSSPNYLKRDFPPDINEPDWKGNPMAQFLRPETRRIAHVFVDRVGRSLAQVDLGTPWRATKFELLPAHGTRLKGLFVHIENVQPRRSDPDGRPGNDAIAPDPGFTEAQLQRLAIVYVVASVRAGRWLVPAYHAVLDAGLSDGHDDPQKFDLAAWAHHLGEVMEQINQAAAR